MFSLVVGAEVSADTWLEAADSETGAGTAVSALSGHFVQHLMNSWELNLLLLVGWLFFILFCFSQWLVIISGVCCITY